MPSQTWGCSPKGLPHARRLFFVVIGLIVSLPPHSAAYQQEVKELSKRLAQSLTAANKKRVAVVDFTDLQGNVTELGRFLAEEVSIGLAEEVTKLDVIDRTHLKAILQEHKLSATGIIDPQTARKLGQISGVDVLVTGTITPFGDSIRVSAKALDTATARLIGAATTQIGRTKAIEELLERDLPAENPRAGRSVSTRPGATAKSVVPEVNLDLARATANDFLFVIMKCSRVATSVQCNGSITNKLSVARDMYLGQGSYLVDDRGNQYRLGFPSLKFASGGNQESIGPNASEYFSFSGDGISREARNVTVIIEIGGWRPRQWGEKVTLRNVAIPEA